MNNCEYCCCKSCEYFKDCEPCSSDWDYEHPCQGGSNCDEYEDLKGDNNEIL